MMITPAPVETWKLFNCPALRKYPPFTPESHKELVIAHLKMIKEVTLHQIAHFVVYHINQPRNALMCKRGLIIFSAMSDARDATLLRAAKIPLVELFGMQTDMLVCNLPCMVCKSTTAHAYACKFYLVPHLDFAAALAAIEESERHVSHQDQHCHICSDLNTRVRYEFQAVDGRAT